MDFILFILYISLGAGGITLFKLGSNNLNLNLSPGSFHLDLPFQVIIGLLCYIISFVLWFYLLSKADISFLSPIATGVMMIVTFAIGVILFKEPINYTKVFGVGIIVIGVIIMNIGGGK